MRIIICAIVTILILCYNYQQVCAPQEITIQNCYYLSINPLHILHVLVANSLLFAVHIKEKIFEKMERYRGRDINVKVVLVVASA
jgi:hypothetical protein